MSLDTALAFVCREFSVTRADVQVEFPRSGDMLTDALLSSGYCMEQGGRIAVAEMGRRRLADVDRGKEAEADGQAE